jgi:hypothetical protein
LIVAFKSSMKTLFLQDSNMIEGCLCRHGV